MAENVFEKLGSQDDVESTTGPDPLDVEQAMVKQIVDSWDMGPPDFKEEIRSLIRDNGGFNPYHMTSDELISMSVKAKINVKDRELMAGRQDPQSCHANCANNGNSQGTNDQTDPSQSANKSGARPKTGTSSTTVPPPSSPDITSNNGPSSPSQASNGNNAQNKPKSPSIVKTPSPKKSTSSNHGTKNNSPPKNKNPIINP
ncbi:unnamed protein product, partial [Rotaria socialis]